jgi:16S rRNA G966 N2-methylase RsmD
LRFPDRPGLRPTGDRLRETLFNWLQPHCAGARCLDLYAGSGALGFEAASRGAARVTLVERDPVTAAALRANRAALGADPAQLDIIAAEALAWLESAQPQRSRPCSRPSKPAAGWTQDPGSMSKPPASRPCRRHRKPGPATARSLPALCIAGYFDAFERLIRIVYHAPPPRSRP